MPLLPAYPGSYFGPATFTGAITVTDTTQSTSTTTGSIITAGGVGIAKNLFVGGDATIQGAGEKVLSIYSTDTGVAGTAKTFIKLYGENSAGVQILQAQLATAPGAVATSAGQLIVSLNSTAGAGNLTERARWDESGNLGLKTSTPDGTLHVHTATAGSVTANAVADDFVVENSGAGGASILVPDANTGYLMFGAASDNDWAFLGALYNSSTLTMATNKVGASLILQAGAQITNLTLSGAAGAELATFAGDVTLSEGRLTITDTANETALSFTSSATTANATTVIAHSLTSGAAQLIHSNSADTSNRWLFDVWNQNTAATGAALVRLTQAAAQCFINFVGTAAANTTDPISTLTTSGATTHHIQIDINGTKAWIAASTNNPS